MMFICDHARNGVQQTSYPTYLNIRKHQIQITQIHGEVIQRIEQETMPILTRCKTHIISQH